MAEVANNIANRVTVNRMEGRRRRRIPFCPASFLVELEGGGRRRLNAREAALTALLMLGGIQRGCPKE